MPVSPAFMQALQHGASLGAQLRAQEAAERRAAEQLRLSFAERAMRQQAQASEQQQQAAMMALRERSAMDDLMFKQQELAQRGQLEEGRNARAAETVDLRRELGTQGNEIRVLAEQGRNVRAQGGFDVRRDLAADANALKAEAEQGRNTRAGSMLDFLGTKEETRAGEFQQREERLREQFRETNDRLKTSIEKLSGRLSPFDQQALNEQLKTLRGNAELSLQPVEMERAVDRLLNQWKQHIEQPKSLNPVPAKASPYKEGETVRNKKTGQEFKIVNGIPVPLGQ